MRMSTRGCSGAGTKLTRAPVAVGQCWIAGPACTAAAPASSISIAPAASSRRPTEPVRVRNREPALTYMVATLRALHLLGTFGVDGLWVELGYGELVVDEVFARHLAHLLGRDGTDAVEILVQQAPAEAERFQRADLHGLIKGGVALIHVARPPLSLAALELVIADEFVAHFGHFGAERR